jgi:hypothetical protein
LFSLFGILSLILVSATRSWLITYIGVVLLAISISRGKSLGGLIKGGIRSLILGGALTAILFAIFTQVMPDVIDRFGERIFVSQQIGFDITTATRIAEMEFQINAWLADIPSFLIGRGLGASYGFAGENWGKLIDLFGYADMQIDWWFAGHNFWVYSLFTQGVLFGWVVPFVILYGLFLSWRGYRSARYVPAVHVQSALSESRLCLLVLVSIVLGTIGGNPLGSRMLSQYIGVIISVSIAVTTSRAFKSDALSSSAIISTKRRARSTLPLN